MNKKEFYKTEVGKALFRFETALTRAIEVDGQSQNIRKIEVCWGKAEDARNELIGEIVKFMPREMSDGESL